MTFCGTKENPLRLNVSLSPISDVTSTVGANDGEMEPEFSIILF